MGAVDLHAVEADLLGGAGGIRERLDHVLDVLQGHGFAVGLAGLEQAGRGITGGVLVRAHAGPAGAAHVPQLGNDRTVGGVHLAHHFLPAVERRFAVERRHAVVARRAGVAHGGALGDQQPHFALGAAPVVAGHFLGGHLARREIAGHGRHRHPVTQLQGFAFKRTEQRGQISAHWGTPDRDTITGNSVAFRNRTHNGFFLQPYLAHCPYGP